MGAYHARLSPSSADQWTDCTAAPSEQDGIPNVDSEDSRAGTVCHQMSAEMLTAGGDADSYLGRTLLFWVHPESESRGESWAEDLTDPGLGQEIVAEVEVTESMVDMVNAGVSFVRELHARVGGVIQVEQRVPIGQFTGEEDAGGTTDVCIITDDTVYVIDFKYGRKKVTAYKVIEEARTDLITGEIIPPVFRANLQMSCYALGTMKKFGERPNVVMVIVQPAIRNVSEYSCALAELRQVEEFLRTKAEETRTKPVYKPTFDNCFFCRAKTTCKERTRLALELATNGLEDVEMKPLSPNNIGELYQYVDFFKDWIGDIERIARERLEQGLPVTRKDGLGYKLVEGRKGDREWKDTAEVEAVFDRARLRQDQKYKMKLISPADAEKLARPKRAKKGEKAEPATLGPTTWDRLQQLIHQEPGKPAIALETDPRPAIKAKTDGLEDVADNCDDLF